MQTITNVSHYDNDKSLKKKKLPYVGATGFTMTWDVEEAIDYYYKYRREKSYEFMMGFLLSYKTVKYKEHPDPVKRGRYPDMATILKLLEVAEYDDVFRVIHYNTRNQLLFDEVSYFLEDLGWKSVVDGIQFNVRFPPDKQEIDLIVSKFPRIKIIIQINRIAIESCKNFNEIINKITDYHVDYILIDPSCGTGKKIDVHESSMQYKLLKSRMDVMIGFAGGFNPDNVGARVTEYKNLLGNGESFCIDAESGLMNDSNKMDMKRVKWYLKSFFTAV